MMVSDLRGAETEAFEEEVTSISGFDSRNARKAYARAARFEPYDLRRRDCTVKFGETRILRDAVDCRRIAL